jgi:hypothetical protein
MDIKLEETVRRVATVNGANGLVDADELPAVTVLKNGVAVAELTDLEMSKISTGLYTWSHVLGVHADNGAFAVGDAASVVATAIVDEVEWSGLLLDGRVVAEGVELADGSITSAKFSVEPITGVATGHLEKQDQLWRSRYEKSTTTGTTTSGERKEYADDGTTVIVTQAWSDNGSTSTQSKAT